MQIIAELPQPELEQEVAKRGTSYPDLRTRRLAVPVIAKIIGAFSDLGLKNEANILLAAVSEDTFRGMAQGILAMNSGHALVCQVPWEDTWCEFEADMARFSRFVIGNKKYDVRVNFRDPNDPPNLEKFKARAEGFFMAKPHELVDVSIGRPEENSANFLMIEYACADGIAVTGHKVGFPIELWENMPDEVLLKQVGLRLLEFDKARNFLKIANHEINQNYQYVSNKPKISAISYSDRISMEIETFDANGVPYTRTIDGPKAGLLSCDSAGDAKLLALSDEIRDVQKKVRAIFSSHDKGVLANQAKTEDFIIDEFAARWLICTLGKNRLMARLRELDNARASANNPDAQPDDDLWAWEPNDPIGIRFEDPRQETIILRLKQGKVEACFCLDPSRSIYWDFNHIAFEEPVDLPLAQQLALIGRPLSRFLQMPGSDAVTIRDTVNSRAAASKGRLRKIFLAPPDKRFSAIIDEQLSNQ